MIDKNHQPPIPNIPSFDHWERDVDPWHVDAAPTELKDSKVWNTGKRKEGWMAVDWIGNPLGFLPDTDDN